MNVIKSRNGVVVDSDESVFKALKKLTIFAIVIGLLIVYFSGLLMTHWYYLAALSFLLILVLSFHQSLEIDVKNVRYRNGFRFFKFMIGTWIYAKEISYLSIFPTLGSKG